MICPIDMGVFLKRMFPLIDNARCKMCKIACASGPFRDSNPGPSAPGAGFMPLDQTDALVFTKISVNINSYFL